MLVKDLIEKLKEQDPNAEVIVKSSNFELCGAYVPLDYISISNTGLKKKETFRDAFDGCAYSTEVWKLSGGAESIVIID
jgi:hypothetical protein